MFEPLNYAIAQWTSGDKKGVDCGNPLFMLRPSPLLLRKKKYLPGTCVCNHTGPLEHSHFCRSIFGRFIALALLKFALF